MAVLRRISVRHVPGKAAVRGTFNLDLFWCTALVGSGLASVFL
jgi:hypothetical protein